ncbi:DUF4286 family protein [Xenorhabdus sp. KK7.4]|uniref:DUF4286 family protein n=1 Tax=Xenorhabdus sp. KK7.4 TaxID=1851572 RepID=UPI000C04074C|nr:DUF4286 family protein [Xenorhabdus sp. KK7.4]PHM51219.1 hypothetical protein Xekk_03877 [Xenorhabdus sp. KK7.4]
MMNESKQSALMLWLHMEGGENALFNHWHNQEHIPQRMEIPGFLSSQRYYCSQSDEYLCYYRLQNQDVLESELYQKQNEMAPSDLAKKVDKHLHLEERKVADLLWSEGNAIGGSMVTARLSIDASQLPTVSELLHVELADLLKNDAICSACLYHDTNVDQRGNNLILMVENANGCQHDDITELVTKVLENQRVECEMIQSYQLQYFLSK